MSRFCKHSETQKEEDTVCTDEWSLLEKLKCPSFAPMPPIKVMNIGYCLSCINVVFLGKPPCKNKCLCISLQVVMKQHQWFHCVSVLHCEKLDMYFMKSSKALVTFRWVSPLPFQKALNILYIYIICIFKKPLIMYLLDR